VVWLIVAGYRQCTNLLVARSQTRDLPYSTFNLRLRIAPYALVPRPAAFHFGSRRQRERNYNVLCYQSFPRQSAIAYGYGVGCITPLRISGPDSTENWDCKTLILRDELEYFLQGGLT
jgi:hypothetical protein